jgi:hypothetical protein
MHLARCRTRRSASCDYNPVMPRRIANGLTLLSAVVCAGSAMLVGRSWFRVDMVNVPIRLRAVTVDGQLLLMHGPYLRASYETGHAAWIRPHVDDVWGDLRGVRWLGVGWGTSGVKVLILPFWLLPLLTAIPPVRWWRARRRKGGQGFAIDGADYGSPADGTGAGDAD